MIALFVAILAVGFASGLWLTPRGLFETWLFDTGGLVQSGLVRGLLALLVEWLLVIVVLGGFAPRDVGLRLGTLPVGLGYAASLWLGAQLLAIAGTLIAGGHPSVGGVWRSESAGFPVGEFLGQLFGLALAEEVVFRGFLLAHCLLYFQRRLARGGTSTALLVAALAFALAQLPEALAAGDYGSFLGGLQGQGALVFWGLVYGLVYVRTRNLFFVIGLHALHAAPTPFFEWPFRSPLLRSELLMVVAAAVLAACWARLPGVSKRRRYEWL